MTNILNVPRIKRLSVCSVAVACLLVSSMTLIGRAAQSDARTTPDISGFWELNFDSRQVPAARLLPSVTRAKIDARAKGDGYAVRWCNLLGMPFVMDPGRPLDIRQGATVIIIAPENSSAPRYLYTNRATHISEDIFDPATNGDSIAHWEGDTLVVDTVGFHGQHGITAIPGGGYRTEQSRLVDGANRPFAGGASRNGLRHRDCKDGSQTRGTCGRHSWRFAGHQAPGPDVAECTAVGTSLAAAQREGEPAA